MNWKEQFELKFSDLHLYINKASNTEGEFSIEYMKSLEDFISTEIIEKMIDEIPDKNTWVGRINMAPVARSIKQQLRDKWL